MTADQDYPECTCPPVKDIFAATAEGQQLAACPVHRPDRPHRATQFALNDSQRIAETIGATLTNGEDQ